MKKILSLGFILVVSLYMVYAFIALTMNYEGVYQKFNAKAAEAGYELKTDSIEVVHFPIPYVILGNISIPNIFSAKKLEIKLSLLSILMLKPAIENIQVSDVNIILSGNRNHFAKHDSSVLEMIELTSKLPELKMYNVSILDKNTNDIDGVRSIFVSPNSSFNQVIINWDDRTNTRITYSKHKLETNVKIVASSQYYNFEIDEIYSGDKLDSGEVKYNISNLKQYVANRYQDLDLLVTKIQSPEQVNMSCKIKSLGDKIEITDLVVKSDSITASGDAELFRSNLSDKINLDIDFLDLNKLLATPNIDLVKESRGKSKLKLSDIESIINVKSKRIILADGELNNVELDAMGDGKQLKVNNLSGDIMNDGKFTMSGVVTQNQYRSLFDGKISLIHKDANIVLSNLGYKNLATATPSNLLLTSDIKATPIDYQLNNLFMQIGSFNADGSMSVKFIGDMPRINLDLGISYIDVSKKDYPVISEALAYIQSLTEDMGSKDYLKKYIPIRTVNYLGSFNLMFKDLKINDDIVDKFHIVADVASNSIYLNSIYYQAGPNYFSGIGYLVASGMKPEISVKVNDAEFFTDHLSADSILKALQGLRDRCDLNKINLNGEIQIKNIEQGDDAFKNITVNAKNDGILWNIKSLGASYHDGSFQSSGSLRMDPMTINLSYAYNNFNITQLSKIFPISVFGLEEGWGSSNGMISTSGDNMAQLLYNLYTKSNFVTKNVKWNNLGIDDLITAINNPEYDVANLQKDTDYYIGNGTTVMNNLSGDLELDHGMFKFTNVVFDTSRISGSAGVNYSIYNSNISLASKLLFSQPATIYNTKPKPVAISFNLSDNVTSPKKQIDFQEVASFLGKRKANKR